MESSDIVTAPLLAGSTALIFGAGSGIGKSTALAMARHGASRLALGGRRIDALDAVSKLLKASWPEVDVVTMSVDVRRADQVQKFIAEIASRFGRIDVAVNNSGILGPLDQLHTTSEEDWQTLIDTNLCGVYRCQKEELAVMIHQEDLGPRRGRGAIINMSSMFGLVGPPSNILLSSYAASKHGIVGLTRADANAYSNAKIRINAICPGYTVTPLNQGPAFASSEANMMKHIEQNCPMQRIATADEIADAIVFLASPMSSYVHGAVLVADGGLTSN